MNSTPQTTRNRVNSILNNLNKLTEGMANDQENLIQPKSKESKDQATMTVNRGPKRRTLKQRRLNSDRDCSSKNTSARR